MPVAAIWPGQSVPRPPPIPGGPASGHPRGRLALAGRLAPFLDPGRLAAQRAEVVKLGPANPAAGHDLDLVDRRAVHGKGPLHAHAVADLADREGLAGAATLAAKHHALEHLNPRAATLDDPNVNLQRVTRTEFRDVRSNLCLLKLGNRGVHRCGSSFSSRARLRTR